MISNPDRRAFYRTLDELPPTKPRITKGLNVSIHPTATLGESGVTLERDENGEWIRFRNHGDIEIGDNVEIGPHCDIKRASLPNTATIIGEGSKLCTYVNVGHNCRIGKHNFIGPHVCFNGSVETGDNVWIGAHAVIHQGIKIGSGAIVGMGSVIVNDIPEGSTVAGVPAIPIQFLGNYVHPSFKHGVNLQMGKFNHIHEGVEVGDNCVIRSYVELRSETIIGNNCYIDSGVKSSGKCKIGNNVTIRYDTIIARNVIIENDVFISPQVMFINIPFNEKEKKPTIICRGAKIGTNATINDGVKIGEDIIIGAKAFVNCDCIEKGVYVGIPARRLQK